MRFLADESCDFAVVTALRAVGHDVTAIVEINPGAEDDVVLGAPPALGRFGMSFEADFLAFVAATEKAQKELDSFLSQFFVGEVVKPSGRGRTAAWEGMVGTVVRVEGSPVFVQWHNVAVEDEMDSGELVSTATFQQKVPHHARVLSEDGELVTFYDNDEKK